MKVHVAQADIATLPVDAVVLPCDSMGVIVHSLATKLDLTSIIEELKARAPLAIGAAIVTNSDAFAANSVIVVPTTRHEGDTIATELLRKGVKAALIAAHVKKLDRIAIPSLVPVESLAPTPAEAARSVTLEMRQHEKEFPDIVYLVDPEESMIASFEEAIHHAQHSL